MQLLVLVHVVPSPANIRRQTRRVPMLLRKLTLGQQCMYLFRELMMFDGASRERKDDPQIKRVAGASSRARFPTRGRVRNPRLGGRSPTGGGTPPGPASALGRSLRLRLGRVPCFPVSQIQHSPRVPPEADAAGLTRPADRRVTVTRPHVRFLGLAAEGGRERDGAWLGVVGDMGERAVAPRSGRACASATPTRVEWWTRQRITTTHT
jgi:hypothetical protein